MNYELSLDLDDLVLCQKNREEGIAAYIDGQNKYLGKVYVTPRGPYSVLKEVEREFGMYRKTILQRFKSKRANLAEWYVIEGNTPLQPEEVCDFCDEVDDVLFEQDCWLDRCYHEHNTPMEDETVITYLFEGAPYKTTYGELTEGVLPHLRDLDKLANGDPTEQLTFGELSKEDIKEGLKDGSLGVF
jgi:hypothetical protein